MSTDWGWRWYQSASQPPAAATFCLFFPRGGLPVPPGKTYSINLSGGEGLFGWKYVVGGYVKGSAWFNSRPLLKDARSSFLFHTFGAM